MNTRRAAWAAILASAGLAAWAAGGCDGIDWGGSTPTAGSAPRDSEACTILLCPPYWGPDHVREAAEAKRKTQNVTRWQGLYVVHEDRSSSLFLGRYVSQEEAARDLKKVRQWKTSEGAQPFQFALVTKPLGLRVGPPEWDLATAAVDPNGYTVVVGVSFNDPDERITTRKEMAVEDCRYLRGQGYEAYYYHGPEQSFVTIGNFPDSAWRMVSLPGGGVQAVVDSQAMNEVLQKNPHLSVNRFADKVKFIDPATGKENVGHTSSYVTAISEFRAGRAVPAAPRGGQPQPR